LPRAFSFFNNSAKKIVTHYKFL